MTTRKKQDEARAVIKELGIDEGARKLGISRETARRYMRAHNDGLDKPGERVDRPSALLEKIAERYTEDELRSIASGGSMNPYKLPKLTYNFNGEEFRFGFCTDTHIGEESFNDALWVAFIKQCEREKVQKIFHAGDVHEGMSHRPGQIYHLTDIGVSAQMDHSERLFKMTDIDIIAISGNHDRWALNTNGLYMVRDLTNRMPGHVFYLGEDYGTYEVNGTKWMLFHGEDGSCYATSYRVQRKIASFQGGQKPAVLLNGHDHKALYLPERNVHSIQGGALSFQSAWMRSKGLACASGFWTGKATIRDKQVVSFTSTFYPFYE